MGVIQRIIAVLIPSESREHVLGDLQQTGFRLRDVVTVVPGTWLAHCHRYLVREWAGDIPRLAGAPDGALDRRAAQIRRSLRWGYAMWFWMLLSTFAGQVLQGWWMLAPGFVFAADSLLAIRRTKRREQLRSPLERYRAAILHPRLAIAAFGPFASWILIVRGLRGSFRSPWGVPLVIAGVLITGGLTFYRKRRLMREREAFLR